MNFGKFDRQITLQAPAAPTQNTFGEAGPAVFADVATVWAERKPLPAGQEQVQALELTAVQPAVYQCRYRPGVLPTWQLIDAGTTYQITAVAEIGRKAGLLLTCFTRG